MKRKLKRLGIGILMFAITLSLVTWVALTKVLIRPPNYEPDELQAVELRSWPEHNDIYGSTDFPYVISIINGDGALEYVGALHTSDAAAPQLKEIEKRWNTFKPTVALCEGRKRMFRYASRPASGTLSESDLLRILAYQNDVPLFTLEPPYESEVAGLLKHCEPRMVATYLTLRVYTSESSGLTPDAQNRLALQLLRKRTDVGGLRETLNDLDDFDKHWNEQFPDGLGWRTLTNPDRLAPLRAVGDVSRTIRGQHMISTIEELVRQGERVFAVVGASHVIRQELELKRLLAN